MLSVHEGHQIGGGGGDISKQPFQITFYACEFNTFYYYHVH